MLSKEELLSRNDDETTKLPDSDEQEIQVLDPPSKVPPLLIDLPGFVRTRNGHCSTECNEKEKQQQAVFNEKNMISSQSFEVFYLNIFSLAHFLIIYLFLHV
jgi:hypothetical protein